MNPHKISIIVNFYNMRREAERTLYSLTANYQKNIQPQDYEVICIDNGSTEPLKKEWVESFGPNFSYVFFEADNPSPCKAINYAVKNLARFENVCICIDGARILSPQILLYAQAGLKAFENAFVYTIGMHIGNKVQNELIKEGYNQHIEDSLIASVNWQQNGYELFKISSLALSSKEGFLGPISESNCFAVNKTNYMDMGGYDEKFISPGGGLCNHDIFNRAHAMGFAPVRLLGETTFHQFHGGVATNVKNDHNHPYNKFLAEYETIKSSSYSPIYRKPHLIGMLNQYSRSIFKA